MILWDNIFERGEVVEKFICKPARKKYDILMLLCVV